MISQHKSILITHFQHDFELCGDIFLRSIRKIVLNIFYKHFYASGGKKKLVDEAMNPVDYLCYNTYRGGCRKTQD